jgi:hypothetical protein
MSETVGAECELLPGHLASAGMAHSTNAKRNPLIFLIEIPPPEAFLCLATMKSLWYWKAPDVIRTILCLLNCF